MTARMHLTDGIDDAAKQREWRIQRVLWTLTALTVLLVAAGAVGGGPLSEEHETVRAGDATFSYSYERINRRDHVSHVFLTVHAPGAEGDTLEVSLTPHLAAGMSVRSTVPDADGGSVGPDGPTYVFQVDDWSDPLDVMFEYTAKRAGTTSGGIVVKAGDAEPERLPFTHFVFP